MVFHDLNRQAEMELIKKVSEKVDRPAFILDNDEKRWQCWTMSQNVKMLEKLLPRTYNDPPDRSQMILKHF